MTNEPRQQSSEISRPGVRLGVAVGAVLAYLVLVDAAVETAYAGAPVRWIVGGTVAAYLALSVLLIVKEVCSMDNKPVARDRRGGGTSWLRLTGAFGFMASLLLLTIIRADTQSAYEDWGRQVVDKLEAFLPAPAPGLTEPLPWLPRDVNQVNKNWGCGETGCSMYHSVFVSREWRFTDPASVKEYAVLTAQEEAALKRSEELGALGPKASQQDWKKVTDEINQIADKKTRIERSTRSILVQIWVNTTDGDKKPTGSIKGYPLVRYVSGGVGGIDFSVTLGPQGFKNPSVTQGQQPKTEVKCVLVRVWVRSDEQSAASDETLARQMLETMDFAGLAKLLTP